MPRSAAMARRAVGEAAGPGSAGAVALRPDVAERRRGPGAGAVRPGGRATCWRARPAAQGILAGAGAPRRDRQGQPCRDQPARSAGRLPVRGADDASQRRPPAAEALEFRSAHAYLSAPYGVYPAARRLSRHRHDADRQARRPAAARGSSPPIATTPSSWFTARDEIKTIIAAAHRDRHRSTNGWPSSSRPTSGAPRC